MTTLKQIGSFILGLSIIAAIVFVIRFFSPIPKNAPTSKDWEDAEYEPKVSHLYPLYLEELKDTVINREDSTVNIIQVTVIRSWKFKEFNEREKDK